MIARCDPRFLGQPFSGWSLSKLRDYLIATGHVATISIETVRRILHERGVTWDEVGDHAGAEALLRQAADRGDVDALMSLAGRREAAGDVNGALALVVQAVNRSNIYPLKVLARWRKEAGDHGGADRIKSLIVVHPNATLIVPGECVRIGSPATFLDTCPAGF